MATLGIPEALSALKIAYDLAVKLKDEAAEIEAVEKSMRRVRDKLALLKERMDDPKSPISMSGDRITRMLNEDMSDIKKGTSEVERILRLREQIPWWEFGSRGIFVVMYIPKMKLVAQSFEVSQNHISQVIAIIQTDASKRAASFNEKEKKKAEEMVKKQDAKLDKMLVMQEKQRREFVKMQQEVAKMLEFFKAKDPKVIADTALHGSSKMKDAWVQELVDGGMNRKEARTRLEDTLTSVRAEHQRSESASVKKQQAPKVEKDSSAAKEKDQKAGNKPEVEKTTNNENTWILCVDESNGGSQTYLELVRSWTVNTTMQWLFGHINSAGVNIPTAFTKPYLPKADDSQAPKQDHPASKAAINAIAGDDSFFWSRDPNEKAIIIERMGSHKSAAVSEGQFHCYKYIICFTEGHRKLLENLKDVAITNSKTTGKKVVSKIHLLKSTEWFVAPKHMNQRDLLKLCGQVKVAIKGFLKEEFGWERPLAGISKGKWRTLQFVVEAAEAARLKKKDKALIKKIEKKYDCRVFREFCGDNILVSVSGPRENLEGAKKMIVG